MTETLSLKVPKELKVRLRAAAESRHTTTSVILREALDAALAGHSASQAVSLYDLSRDLFERSGRGGPRDLSTNSRYLDDFGR